MPFEADVLRVFIASPGDLGRDRDEVEATIHEWNRQHSQTQRVVLLPQRWEGAAARQGGDGQQQINEQQVKDSDIVLAMFHTRLGKATDRAESGTAEEIELGEKYDKPTHVLVSRRTVDMADVDLEEHKRLTSYLEKVRKRGLTKDFRDESELRREVNNVLWLAVNEHISRRSQTPDAEAVPSATESSDVSYASSLGFLVSVIPGYPDGTAELDPSIRALTAFADVLAQVTKPARELLSAVLANGGLIGGRAWGMTTMEVCRRLEASPEQVRDLVAELDRYDLAFFEDADEARVILVRTEPANLNWGFWDELRQLDSVAPGAITSVVGNLHFSTLDDLGEEGDAAATGTVNAEGRGIDGAYEVGAATVPSTPDVRWSLTRKKNNTYVLRNIGTDVATNVSVVPESAAKLVRNLPIDATIRPNASVEFTMFESWGSPIPNEVLVSSEGFEDEPQVVVTPAS